MNVDEAIAVVDDVFENIGDPYRNAWDFLRTHLTRKVDDAMVERAMNAYVSEAGTLSAPNLTLVDHDAMRAALIAALGGDDEA